MIRHLKTKKMLQSEKKPEPVEDDNWFLSYSKDRYDKEFKSIDEFVLLNSDK